MLILPEQKTVFISVPKTAGTSMHYALNSIGYQHPEPELYHMSAKTCQEKYPETKSYSKFAFVRNPYDRLVSVWNDFKFKRKTKYSGEVTLDKPLLHEYNTFDEFVLDLPNSEYFKDVHVRPQWTFTHKCTKHNFHNSNDEYYFYSNLMRHVGKFENLEKDFDWIVFKRNLNLVKPLTVNNSTNHKHYSEYYTNPKVVATVIKMYIKDFEIFNYSCAVGDFKIGCHEIYNNDYNVELKCKDDSLYMFSFNDFERRQNGCEY